MIKFKPEKMTETEFYTKIEEKGANHEELQLLIAIRDLISRRFTIVTSVDSILLVTVGCLVYKGLVEHSFWTLVFGVFANLLSMLTKWYSNELLKDQVEAIETINEIKCGLAYEVKQSES